MTFDYLRPAFAGTICAVPQVIRSGKRFIITSVEIYQNQTLVAMGRFIYTR
jgi:acyl-coenzyme A thioesterase PaaI-like protein